MTSLRKTVLSLSQLNINDFCIEGSPEESVSSEVRREETELENKEETGVPLRRTEASTVDEINVPNEAEQASGVGNNRQMVSGYSKCKFCSVNGTKAGETMTPCRTSDINIHDNCGTINVIVALPPFSTPSTDRGIKRKTSDSCVPPVSKAVRFSEKSQTICSFRSLRNARRNQPESNRIKRRVRQTLINFRQGKKRGNIKSALGQILCEREYDEADGQTVNINVNNNQGVIVIGNENTVNSVSRQRLDLDGESLQTDGGVMVSPHRCPSYCIDRNTKIWLERVYRITNEIYPLRDNGEWHGFYQKVNKGLQLAKQYGLPEEEILFTIEKSVGLSYQGKKDESKKMVKQARDMILTSSHLNVREFLNALLHCALAAHYRRDNKLLKAKRSIDLAEQCSTFSPCALLKSYIMYEKARLPCNQFVKYSYHPASDQDNSYGCEEEAKKCFEDCISMCELTLSENDAIYLRRHPFCLVMLARMNLKCETTASRSQPVSSQSISAAGDCIMRMENYSDQMSECLKLLLVSAQTGLFHRLGDYPTAEKFARKALRQAKKLGYEIEIGRLQEHLCELSQLKLWQQHTL